MTCAWQELLSILPPWLAQETDKQARHCLQEIRMRSGQAPELNCGDRSIWLARCVTRDDIHFCINTASRYSPWAAQTTARGYLTANGGHRIGLCGEAVIKDGIMSGFSKVTSLCIRIARDYPGIGVQAAALKGNILLIGPPGSGKTTLLRDMARQISEHETVCVVDERQELFPDAFFRGKRIDVLSGCPKPSGIDMALRCMGPSCIIMDEITAADDCNALIKAGWCAVRLIATAHAASLKDLYNRILYRPIMECRLFDHILVLGKDKSWHEERMML